MTALYAHQAEALQRMEGREAFALLMSMRTGKTLTLLRDFDRLLAAERVRNLMVIAPGGVYRTWVGQIREHLNTDVEVCTWVSGAGLKERRRRDAFMKNDSQPRILLMNIEALSAVREARELAIAFLEADPTMLAIDESTAIKTPSAKRTKFINRTLSPLAAYRRILCGLPTPQSPLDLYCQFEFLDWHILGHKSFYTFRNRYAIIHRVRIGGREVPLVKGYANLDELNAKIAPFSYRKRLEDCYDLPDKVYSIREVTMTNEQKRLYTDMKEKATTQLDTMEHVTATIVLSQILRMHQILCGHVVDELGTFHEIAENRTNELITMLEEYDGKAIVWCSYDADVKKVATALEKAFGPGCVARFWGGNRTTRESEEARFLNEPACRFMVSTAAAGGRGRTWTCAGLIVYYSNTASLEHRSQSEDRAQAIGKSASVGYVDLMVPGTVEEKIIANLRAKIDIASTIMGDGYRKWLI